jgi:hypothetical protein
MSLAMAKIRVSALNEIDEIIHRIEESRDFIRKQIAQHPDAANITKAERKILVFNKLRGKSKYRRLK